MMAEKDNTEDLQSNTVVIFMRLSANSWGPLLNVICLCLAMTQVQNSPLSQILAISSLVRSHIETLLSSVAEEG